MSVYYPPPQPFVGGSQPLAPPIVVQPNPLAGVFPKRRPEVPTEVRQWWDVFLPMPQGISKVLPNPLVGAFPKRAPVGLPTEVRAWFDVPLPMPQPTLGIFHVISNPLAGVFPWRRPELGAEVRQWYDIPPPMPQPAARSAYNPGIFPVTGTFPWRRPEVGSDIRQWFDVPPPMPQPAAPGVYNPAIFPISGTFPWRPPMVGQDILAWWQLAQPPPQIGGPYYVPVPPPISTQITVAPNQWPAIRQWFDAAPVSPQTSVNSAALNPLTGYVPPRASGLGQDILAWWQLAQPPPQIGGPYYVPVPPPISTQITVAPNQWPAIRQWFDAAPVSPQTSVNSAALLNPLTGYVPPRASGLGQDILSWWQVPLPLPISAPVFASVGPTFQVSMTIPANFAFTGFAS